MFVNPSTYTIPHCHIYNTLVMCTSHSILSTTRQSSINAEGHYLCPCLHMYLRSSLSFRSINTRMCSDNVTVFNTSTSHPLTFPSANILIPSVCLREMNVLTCMNSMWALTMFKFSPLRWSRRDVLAGSNPAELDGFFQDAKILSKSPPGGTLSWGSRVWDFWFIKEPQAWKNRPLTKT